MSTQELYNYINERIEELSNNEKISLLAGLDVNAIVCVSKKNELLDLKAFTQSNERKLKS